MAAFNPCGIRRLCKEKCVLFFAYLYFQTYKYRCLCIGAFMYTYSLCRWIITNIIKVKAVMHSQLWNAAVTESWQQDLR